MHRKLKSDWLNFDNVFIVFSGCLFLLGSAVKFNNYTLPISIASSIFIIGIWMFQEKVVKFPKGFWIYLLFLTSMIIHTFIFSGDATYPILFLSGGLYWLVFSNFRTVNLQKAFFRFFIAFGLILAGVYFVLSIFGIHSFRGNNLFLPLGENIRHNHLGDVWAVILIGLIYNNKPIKIKKIRKLLLIILGIVLVILSFSRSAIVSFAVGILYIYFRSDDSDKPDKKWTTIMLIGTATIFLFSSLFKTTIFSRPYIGESIKLFLIRPQGLGMGNFYKVSPESSVAHNIILELMSGIGVLTIFFVLWLVRIFIASQKNKGNILYVAIFLAILANFLLDTTYTIPSMIWLWFSSLALVTQLNHTT